MTATGAGRVAAVVGRYRRLLTLAAVAVVAGLGFAALHLVLREVHLSQVRTALHGVSAGRLAGALLLTGVSYLTLTLYDWSALSVVGQRQPWRIAALASFTSYTLSHNLGLGLLTGGSARLRVYRAAGLSVADIARVQALAGAAFWGGLAAIAGGALLWSGAPPGFDLPAARPLGLALLALLGVVPLLRASGRRDVSAWGASLPVPDPRSYAVMVAASLVDLVAASAALFVLVPLLGPGDFAGFVVAYAVAVVVALVTHVPGGVGVIEAVMLALVPADRPALFAGLLLYRIIYYLLPLVVALAMLAVVEARRLRQPLTAGLSLIDRAGRAVAPAALAGLVLIGGLVLLVSGALPGVGDRLESLDDVVPLPFIEASHLAASLVGTALILLAPALQARMRSGFLACRLLLLSGAVFSLIKGFDYEEAIVLLAIAGVLQYARPAFTRAAPLRAEPIDLGWFAAAAGAIALSLWAGFFAYKRVPYADDLWWHFALDGNAPRFLRASFAAGILLAAAAWHRLLMRSRRPTGLTQLPPAVAAAAFGATVRTDANLAYTGDKSFIVAAGGDAFLMYRVRGRTWAVMGDPVGDEAAWPELLWAIRRACDEARGRLCIYQASPAMLPYLVELGLSTIKYGEEAHLVPAQFGLAGPRLKAIRHALRRCEAAGASFAVVPAREVAALLPELRAVSDAWLATKDASEKSFSVGRFDPGYLERFELAVVRCGGRIVAFANLWDTASHVELSVDLMRHVPDAPYGIMDYLFVQLIALARERGYRRFNLGMAPLSGITAGPLAPLWARIGTAVFRTGERFYGFAGIRHFKAKFDPVWVPRYIAAPAGIGMVRAVRDLIGLVGQDAD